MNPKLPAFLLAARSRWCTHTADASPLQQQAGQEALAFVAEAYAQTPAYNYQLQLDQLRTRIRQLESDLVAERTASLKLGRQLDQQRAAVFKPKPTPPTVHAAEIVRLRTWLGISLNERHFTHERLHNLQTELRRRLTKLERTGKNKSFRLECFKLKHSLSSVTNSLTQNALNQCDSLLNY